MKEITINMQKPPEQRWQALNQPIFKQEAKALVDYYLKDILIDNALEQYLPMLEIYKSTHISKSIMVEMNALASLFDYEVNEIIIANLYYDLIKMVIGCTAFAFNTPQGPMHGRNLDWFSDNNGLKGLYT